MFGLEQRLEDVPASTPSTLPVTTPSTLPVSTPSTLPVSTPSTPAEGVTQVALEARVFGFEQRRDDVLVDARAEHLVAEVRRAHVLDDRARHLSTAGRQARAFRSGGV